MTRASTLLPRSITGTRGAEASPTTSRPGAVAADCLAVRSCYAPRALRVAYGIQPLLDRGITGRGQTVVLLEFPPLATGSPPAVTGIRVPASSDIRQDLARFDSVFGMPAARLQVVNSLAHAPSPWLASIEEVGDTEIVHALAPGAAIREVLIPSSYVPSLGKAVGSDDCDTSRIPRRQSGPRDENDRCQDRRCRFSFVARGATSSRLLLRFVKGPKEKSQRRASGRTTRPVLRDSRRVVSPGSRARVPLDQHSGPSLLPCRRNDAVH